MPLEKHYYLFFFYKKNDCIVINLIYTYQQIIVKSPFKYCETIVNKFLPDTNTNIQFKNHAVCIFDVFKKSLLTFITKNACLIK